MQYFRKVLNIFFTEGREEREEWRKICELCVLTYHAAARRAKVEAKRWVENWMRDRGVGDFYLDWDNQNHQDLILAGPSAVADYCELDRVRETLPVLVFDELHKFARWKNF